LLNPPAHVDPVAYVDSLVAQLRGVAPEILTAVAETIGRDRKRDLPSLPDILAIAADHAAVRKVRDRVRMRVLRRDIGELDRQSRCRNQKGRREKRKSEAHRGENTKVNNSIVQ
jgi:hypothetical protein